VAKDLGEVVIARLEYVVNAIQSAIYDLDILHLILVTLSTQHSMPIMDIGTQAATTLIRPVFRERGFRRNHDLHILIERRQ